VFVSRGGPSRADPAPEQKAAFDSRGISREARAIDNVAAHSRRRNLLALLEHVGAAGAMARDEHRRVDARGASRKALDPA